MYLKQPIVWFSLTVLAILAGLNNLAFKYYLYWYWPWFDKVMHFLAGLLIGWVALWLYFSVIRPKATTAWSRVLSISLFSALVIGGLWEMLEFGVDRFLTANIGLRSLADLEARLIYSLADIAADLVGGLAAGISFKTWPWLRH